jgi:hypothetical protein
MEGSSSDVTDEEICAHDLFGPVAHEPTSTKHRLAAFNT